MKVSTDSLIFGSYVPISKAKRALDLGTGSGILALMLAQRSAELQIDAIDCEAEAVGEAAENAAVSPWPQRIQTYQADVRDWQNSYRYELIVCNPPYFPEQLVSPQLTRQLARQGDTEISDWLRCARRNLSAAGRFYWIIPHSQRESRAEHAQANGFHLRDELLIFSTAKKPAKLVIQGWQLQPATSVAVTGLTIHAGAGYSAEYRELTGDFYLAGKSQAEQG
ncbi:tRNA1(Val) (adenine(37)-N6)-methyltransferase [Pseudidiomarina halophila]|nr:methyltransferase [Pseudidiomarina halophila]